MMTWAAHTDVRTRGKIKRNEAAANRQQTGKKRPAPAPLWVQENPSESPSSTTIAGETELVLSFHAHFRVPLLHLAFCHLRPMVPPAPAAKHALDDAK